MFVHYFTSFELFVVEMDYCVFEFGHPVQELTFHDLYFNIKQYLSVFSDCSFLLDFLDRFIFGHLHSFGSHFPHDLSCLLVVEIIEFIMICFTTSSGLLLTLLFLLHDDFVTDGFLHYLWVQTWLGTMLLRIFPISSFYIVDGNLEWLQIQIFGFDAFYEFFLLYENYLGRQGFSIKRRSCGYIILEQDYISIHSSNKYLILDI